MWILFYALGISWIKKVIISRNISDFMIVGHTVAWLAEHLEKNIQYKFQSEIF